MDQRKALMAIGGVILVLLLIVFGVAYYSVNSSKKPNRRNTNVNLAPSASGSGVPQANIPVTGSASSTKLYSGSGFSLHYPNNWGLLKCSNTSNFELDPDNSTDQLGVSCDRAVKPVTILVSTQALSCSGDSVSLGSNKATKLKQTLDNGDIWYRWCVNGSTGSVNISHRVSQKSSPASSATDYSVQVEQVISSLNFGAGGS